MKIAFLILAHGNIKQLNCFLRQLLKYEDSFIYIHLDIKAGDVDTEIINDDRVEILPQRLDVKWGDYSQIEAAKSLLEYAYSKGYYDWYSVHSGVDMAIKPVREFAQYLNDNNNLYYAQYSNLPCNGWRYKGGYGRLFLYWPKFLRKRTGQHSWRRYVRAIYGRMYDMGLISGKKISEKYTFYGGSSWHTISNLCVHEMLLFLKENEDYDQLFKNSFCADEIYFNTILEAIRKGRNAVSKNCLRYIDWSERGQKRSVGGPNTCSMDFVNEIEKSGNFFARKFDSNFDEEIVKYFENKF